MLQNLLPLLLLQLSFASFSQSNEEELISWNEEKKLTWVDYKGTAKPGTDAAASTATYLGIEYNFNSKGFGYKITCNFSKTKSWGLHKTDYILAHEQGHFDIAEIFARKLNMKMSDYKFNKNSFKTDLKKIYETITSEKEEMQNSYDSETNHSINKEKQKEWLKKIDQLLREYRDFSGYNQ
ncbi:MAG: DUF922 domain-containing protein [Chitinophagaceae bacterium]